MLGLVGFGLKAALAAAAWYVTYDMGIWGTSDDTHEIYRTYCRIIKGPCEEKAEKWEPVQCKAEKELMRVCNKKLALIRGLGLQWQLVKILMVVS